MAVGQRFQVLDVQTFLGQEVLNVYYYKATGGPEANAINLWNLLNTNLIPLVLPLQSVDLDHTVLQIINLDDLDDFYASMPTPNHHGSDSGDNLPPYACFSIRINRATRAVRNGQKRIAGMTEAAQNNGIANSSYVTVANALATGIAATQTDTDGNQYTPVIMHKVVVHGVPVVYTDYPLSSAEYVRISTQNTRKYGRGA